MLTNGILASPTFLSTTLHVISAISMPIHFFGMCAILFKTPEIMKKLKWYLLCLHISTVLFDCSISILTIPVILFPEFAGYPLGVFKLVDPKYYVYPVVLAIMFMGGLMNIAVIFTTIHGLSSTIMMIMVHQPYRQFLMSIFCNERVVEKRGLSRKNVIIVALDGYVTDS
ncbi:unnamed protein product [Caenorhabditis nigoni]